MRRRNRILLAILAVAIIGAFAFSVFAQSQKSQKEPKAVFEQKTASLGDVVEGQDITHTFVVRNKGDADLQIISVRPG